MGWISFWFTIVFLIALFFVVKTIVIIPERENGIMERLGKFRAVLSPGWHIMIPLVDEVSYRHEIREQVLDVPAQSCITKDNIQVEVDGLVYIKVMNAQQASYGIGDYRMAAVNLAQTTMRSEMGKLTLNQSFSEREKLNQTVVSEIDRASDPWGIKVMRYEIMNIIPSQHVVQTLEKQMEAERSRRAEVTLATAEKESVSLVSEGERQEMINISEGEKLKRVNEADGRAQEIAILAEATAFGVRSVATAIAKPSGTKAVQMRIMQQYLTEFGKICSQANVSVVPGELANIKGFFQGINQVSQTMDGGKSTQGDV